MRTKEETLEAVAVEDFNIESETEVATPFVLK